VRDVFDVRALLVNVVAWLVFFFFVEELCACLEITEIENRGNKMKEGQGKGSAAAYGCCNSEVEINEKKKRNWERERYNGKRITK